jgi:hypothetical protein
MTVKPISGRSGRIVGPRRQAAMVLWTLVLLSGTAWAEDRGADLRGAWRLNRELSQDLSTRFQDIIDEHPMEPTAPDGPGPRPAVEGVTAVAGQGVAGDATTGLQETRDPQAVIDRLEDLAEGVASLDIDYEKPMLVVLDAGGRERVLNTAGRTIKVDMVDGRLVIRAKWKQTGTLVVTTNSDFAFRMIEEWKVDADTGRLHITNDIYPVMGLPHITVRRVYDRDITGKE